MNREYFIIRYRTDPEQLRALVPAPLQIEAPLVRYEFIRMPDCMGRELWGLPEKAVTFKELYWGMTATGLFILSYVGAWRQDRTTVEMRRRGIEATVLPVKALGGGCSASEPTKLNGGN